MDNLSEKINSLLQDPDTMAQLQSFAAMLGNNVPDGTPAPVPAPPENPTVPSPEMMQTVMKLMPLLQDLRRETPGTQFLHALRPLLSDPRRKRLDGAVRIVQLMNLLPTLQKSGLLNQLL